MGRPKSEINVEQLKALMRLKPTIEDTAAFFQVHPDTILKFIKREIGPLTFSEFREQNMVHTRFSLIRTAIDKAERGDNVMLIFCLKNLCGWRDKNEDAPVAIATVATVALSESEHKELVKKARDW
jgi:hypothetical protein